MKIKMLFTKKKNIVIASIVCVFLLLAILSIPKNSIIRTYAKRFLDGLGIYNSEVFKISVKTDNYDEEGEAAWKLDKKAEWISRDKVKLTIQADTVIMSTKKPKDVILVYDISGSMQDEKIEEVKKDTKNLFTYLFGPNSLDNKVALISFSDNSSILSELTNDRTALEAIVDNITIGGNTNYNAAYKNVERLLDNYTYDGTRDVSVLFLTDGYPNVEASNQVTTFELLKNKYPFIRVDGIQYEMGDSIIKEIKDVSDNQYVAWHTDISEILKEAVLAPYSYNRFIINDYINTNYFNISEEDITVNYGTVTLDNNKVTWNMNNKIKTGQLAVMEAILTLKDEYVNQDGFYNTNTSLEVNSLVQGINEVNKQTNDTPVLNPYHKVYYDTNPPAGCERLQETSEEGHFVFDRVEKQDTNLTCAGYAFHGYKIQELDVKLINDDYFVMPGHDVHIKGVWSRQSIVKSTEGEMATKATLYSQVKYDAENDRSAFEYTREINDTNKTLSEDETYNVYYYKGGNMDNNVIFGNFCWKIMRTTITGGVKMIYNGVPTYDLETNSYSCNNIASNAQIGEARWNTGTESLAYFGYMYNKVYPQTKKTFYASQPILESSYMLDSPKYYYGDTYEYVSGKYKIKNSDNSSLKTFTDWGNEYNTFNGLYTCKSDVIDNDTCTKLYYVSDVSDSKMYNLVLEQGRGVPEIDITLTFGSNYQDNGDGTYTLTGTTSLTKSQWNREFNNIKGMYSCEDYVSTTCNNIYYISDTNDVQLVHKTITDNFKYSNSFTYDGTNYTLSGTSKTFWNFQDNYMDLNDTHYTCFNNSGVCRDIYFIYFTRENEAWYIKISDGKGIEDAKNDMLYADNVNTNNSNVKNYIENWYRNNLDIPVSQNSSTKFGDYIEDTIYCNDRTIEDSYGWTENGNMHGYPTWQSLPITAGFRGWGDFRDNDLTLTCLHQTDRFSVSSNIGNGKLSYPVGLLSTAEALLARYEASNVNSNNYYLKSGSQYMLMNPYYVNTHELAIRTISTGGQVNGTFTWYGTGYGVNGVRPVISLIPEIEYSDGDGSVDYPYIVDVG